VGWKSPPIDQVLPVSGPSSGLPPGELIEGNHYTLRVNHHDEVEAILARIRESGAKLDDLQLHQADLEDVFIQIMGGDQ